VAKGHSSRHHVKAENGHVKIREIQFHIMEFIHQPAKIPDALVRAII
jgi:hypothetical protein